MTLRPAHLVARFVSSLRPARVTDADRAWVADALTLEELQLFERMARQDQAHSIAVARRVESHLGELDEALRPIALQAALLHDVGKSVAQLGTYGRVVATVCGLVDRGGLAEAWQRGRGFTRRVGLYLRYGEIGADMLRLAGSDPLVVAWSVEHHLPPDRWTMPLDAGTILAEADG